MTGRRKASESTTSKPKLPDVPTHVYDEKNNRQYLKGGFLGKVRLINHVRYSEPHPLPPLLKSTHQTKIYLPQPIHFRHRVALQDVLNLLIARPK